MPKDSADLVSAAAFSGPAALSYAEVVDAGREAITAAVNSGTALGTALEAIGQEVAQYGRTAFENAGATARGLLGARTIEDVVRLQTDYARRSFEGLVEGSAKLSTLGLTLVTASFGAWHQATKS